MNLSDSRIVIFEGPDFLPKGSSTLKAAVVAAGVCYGAYRLGKWVGKKEVEEEQDGYEN